MFRGPMGPMRGPQGMMGAPQGMQEPMGRGFGGQRGPYDAFGGGMGGGGRGNYQPGHPGMRGPQDMVQPGGPNPWQQFPGGWAGGGPEGIAGPNRAAPAVMPEGWDEPGSPNYRPPQPKWGPFPNMPPQFNPRSPAGGWGGHRGGGFGNQLGAMPGMSGERGMSGGFGGRPQAGPPVPRRMPGKVYY